MQGSKGHRSSDCRAKCTSVEFRFRFDGLGFRAVSTAVTTAIDGGSSLENPSAS